MSSILAQNSVANNGKAIRPCLLLCGEIPLPLDGFYPIICFSPVRYHRLAQLNITNYLFGDFGPKEKRGQELDIDLQERLDYCLHEEARINLMLSMAPLAIQQIKWRLSRYLWLKQCLLAIIKEFSPRQIVLSSNRDEDVVRALGAVAKDNGVEIEIKTGLFDPRADISYLTAPYGLPPKVDPTWFHWLHWRIVRLVKAQRQTWIEQYPNLEQTIFPTNCFPFKLLHCLSFIWAAKQKLRRFFRLSAFGVKVDFSSELDYVLPLQLQAKAWQYFFLDERQLINGLLNRFFKHCPPRLIAKIEARIALMLSIMKPRRVVLSVDQLDASRLFAYTARRLGVPIDYLPHGISFEDYSGYKNDSPFLPNRILAWNEASANNFRKLGWSALPVTHPVNQKTTSRVPVLSPNPKEWKVLILLTDWSIVSQALREDCPLVDLFEAYHGLLAAGITGKQIDVKFRSYVLPGLSEGKQEILFTLRQSTGMEFKILDMSLRGSEVIPNYNLAIIGSTTAIFEAVLTGVPVIFFGRGFSRIGALEGSGLPVAHTPSEFCQALQQYRSQAMIKTYQQITQSFQFGRRLADW